MKHIKLFENFTENLLKSIKGLGLNDQDANTISW